MSHPGTTYPQVIHNIMQVTISIGIGAWYLININRKDITMANDLVKTQSINNVDVTPVFKEIIEYSKDQATTGNLEELISKVPQMDSLDWKLISGVLCNSIIEWVAEDKEDRVELIHHMQSDIGYILKRMGLTM